MAFLTTEYVTESANFDGGLSQYLGRLTRYLLGRGHSVEVFAVSDADETITADGVPVHRVRPVSRMASFLHTQANRVFRHGWHESAHCLAVAATMRRAFLRRHRESPFEIVQATNLQGVPLLLGRGLSPAPVVVRLSSDLERVNEAYGSPPTRDSRLALRLIRLGWRRAASVYAPSRLLASRIREERGVAVRVLPSPFRLEAGEEDSSVFRDLGWQGEYLLFFGTIGRLKGVGALVEALEVVLARCSDVRMLFVGKDYTMGEGRGTGVALIESRLGGFGGRVRRMDRLPHSQLYPLIRHARGVVLPSLIENLPNAAMEAMALGRVVVGTRGTSFEELIEDGKSGLLVEAGDAQGLAAALERVWKMSEADRAAMGGAAREAIERLAPEKTVPELERYYREVIEGRGRSPLARG